ncbi:MAG: hypothetical protein AVDCRST_MAG93-5451 [uncultured Chloroflexia bacterium]|uniref:DUF4438 domain-containing protein n=1 Tax=uncultured Chloroflexia bacterium TaxID=1672391 RepID=A0A6J4KUV0_9CHLR|nr:MAG: hypothetical protein AVDCRST_MAG93-5451 [uncultured Chloroflexia bacterium]
MLRTNIDDLVCMGVTGFVSAPTLERSPYRPDTEGIGTILIGMSGVVYNARVGDAAYGWTGDHVEPGVSIAHPNSDVDHAMHYLACVGNEAVVTSGLAKGARGIVTGEHARLLIDFAPDVLEQLCVGDAIMIKTHGRGMRFLDCPGVLPKKAGPNLIRAWGLELSPEGKLRVPVVGVIPAHIMGSGAELTPEFVDQDLMTGDRAALAELGIDQLKLGDLVAVMDTDHRYGRGYKLGGVSIGVIMHGDSIMTGHGPGCQDLMACAEGEIEPVINPDANIARLLAIR